MVSKRHGRYGVLGGAALELLGFAHVEEGRRPRTHRHRPCGSSAKLIEAFRDHMSVRYARLGAFVHERENRRSESCAERARFDRGDMGILESSKGLNGKVVIAA